MTMNLPVTRRLYVIKTAFRVLSILMVSVAGEAPAALGLYWATSALFSLVQNVIIKRNKLS
jgi:inner membrane protein COX18